MESLLKMAKWVGIVILAAFLLLVIVRVFHFSKLDVNAVSAYSTLATAIFAFFAVLAYFYQKSKDSREKLYSIVRNFRKEAIVEIEKMENVVKDRKEENNAKFPKDWYVRLTNFTYESLKNEPSEVRTLFFEVADYLIIHSRNREMDTELWDAMTKVLNVLEEFSLQVKYDDLKDRDELQVLKRSFIETVHRTSVVLFIYRNCFYQSYENTVFLYTQWISEYEPMTRDLLKNNFEKLGDIRTSKIK